MIPDLLQDTLVNEIKNLFANSKFKNAKDEEVVINVYPQTLPAKKYEKDEAHYPFILVKLVEGEDKGEYEANTCKVVFIIGVVDNADNEQGHKDILHIINKIYRHLFETKIFANKYVINYPAKWSLPEEDSAPYFFGGLETEWNVGKITKNEDLHI